MFFSLFFVFNIMYKQFSGFFAHEHPGLCDRSHLNLRQAGEGNVIKTDHTYIFRDLPPCFHQILKDPERDQVIAAEDAVDVVFRFHQLRCQLVPALNRETAIQDPAIIDIAVQLLQAVIEAVDAFLVGFAFPLYADKSEFCVSALYKMLSSGFTAFIVIDFYICFVITRYA